jgi:hypothetical protein
MRKVTTVSLDEKTAAIAKNMPNFSHFVRECLLRHHASSLNQSECPWKPQERFANRCVPRVKGRPVCFVCWPNGRPSQDLVTSYLREHEDIERLDRETKAENWQLLDLDQNITVQESAKVTSNGGGKANLWSRIKRIFD